MVVVGDCSKSGGFRVKNYHQDHNAMVQEMTTMEALAAILPLDITRVQRKSRLSGKYFQTSRAFSAEADNVRSPPSPS